MSNLSDINQDYFKIFEKNFRGIEFCRYYFHRVIRFKSKIYEFSAESSQVYLSVKTIEIVLNEELLKD